MLKTVLKKIVSHETLNRIPKFRLKFGERFSAERVEHFVIERAEEQPTMLKFIAVGNLSAVGRDNIPKNIEPHGKPKAFAFNVE